MDYERDFGYRGGERERGARDLAGRGEYGDRYEAPYRGDYGRFHGFAMGYRGGALRSRGSYRAGQLLSGLNPRDEFEFDWGEGYVGGRGYGGTNYDYEHGYRTTEPTAAHGPARYGYGPYHERLRRRRRSDDEIRADVEDALFYDTWVDADRITVEVDEGVVTLRGTLPSYDEVRYATDDAWDVDGVRGVRGELRVEERPVADRLARRREYAAADIAEGNVAEAPAGGQPLAGRVDPPEGGAAAGAGGQEES